VIDIAPSFRTPYFYGTICALLARHELPKSAACGGVCFASRVPRKLPASDPSEWIEQSLSVTGTATIRRRRLPADQVVWLVIGIGLFRDRSIEEVVDALDIALPSPTGVVAKSAIPPARLRVGDAPLRWLFERTSQAWSRASAERHRWRGLTVYGMDGSSLRTADTKENRAEFGGWTAGKGDSSNPIVRIVVLMALRSHLLAAARFGSYAGTSELALARELVEDIPAHSLTILDALYLSVAFLTALEAGKQRHWLTKAKSNTKMRVLEAFAEGDALVRCGPRTKRERRTRRYRALGKRAPFTIGVPVSLLARSSHRFATHTSTRLRRFEPFIMSGGNSNSRTTSSRQRGSTPKSLSAASRQPPCARSFGEC
jgi:hypothetical protein